MQRLPFILFLSLFTASLHAAVPSFSRDILPILSDACFQCHGQDAKADEPGKRAGNPALAA